MTTTLNIKKGFEIKITIEENWVSIIVNYDGYIKSYSYDSIASAIKNTTITPLENYLKTINQ